MVSNGMQSWQFSITYMYIMFLIKQVHILPRVFDFIANISKKYIIQFFDKNLHSRKIFICF